MIKFPASLPTIASMCLLSGGFALLPAPGHAEETSLVSRTLEDTKLYFTAPLTWDKKNWEIFGGTVAAIVAAHEYDDNVRAHFTRGSNVVLDGKDRNSSRDALPTAAIFAGTWAYAALLQSRGGYAEGWSMAEAGGLSAVSAYALKFAAGRLRPNETTHVDRWSQSGSSFPSLHATLAFAVGTVLAESGEDNYRWLRRALGYGVAFGTAYVRVHDNVHWLSDAVAGSALGMSTAIFVLNRRENRLVQGQIGLLPVDRGMMLTYSLPLK
jgi:membrane-associated phospholipid phosphatase